VTSKVFSNPRKEREKGTVTKYPNNHISSVLLPVVDQPSPVEKSHKSSKIGD
jgi:hypothetical protein